jgi:signal transduction histidine kinase
LRPLPSHPPQAGTNGCLHERLALGGPPDELTELGDTFDAIADETACAQGLAIRPGLHEACVYGDPSLLGELTDNLIGNAVKYNCPDGWIAVGTRTDGDRVILEISNSGQRIADAELDGLLKPFRRAGQQRTGDNSGLGLSIVRAVVAAHGGELGLRALASGGLAVRVSLPTAPAGKDTRTPHRAGHDDGRGQALSVVCPCR